MAEQKSKAKKEKIIGIDLGTSNSAAAVLQAGKPTIIPSAEGTTAYGKAFPSVVAFTKDGQVLVGEPARRQAVSNPEGTITAAKRKMGTNFKYKNNGKEYTPQQISASILQKIKKDAEEFIGETISKAVITVPANFDDNQRQATKDAGTIAGLEVERLVNEPTAASMAYGIDKHQRALIAVYDFGGGTFDISILRLEEGLFKVQSTNGDTHLGGDDIDNLLLEKVRAEIRTRFQVEVADDADRYQVLREAVIAAKHELSEKEHAPLRFALDGPSASFPSTTLRAGRASRGEYARELTRAEFESWIAPIIERTLAPCR